MKTQNLILCVLLNLFGCNDKYHITINGDYDILKEDAIANIVFDFEGTKWDGTDSFKEKSGNDYEQRVEISKKSFIQTFNSLSKGFKISDDANAKYKICFKITNLEQHSLFCATNGAIEIIDQSSNQVLCSMGINEVAGNRAFCINNRIINAFEHLAKVVVRIEELVSYRIRKTSTFYVEGCRIFVR